MVHVIIEVVGDATSSDLVDLTNRVVALEISGVPGTHGPAGAKGAIGSVGDTPRGSV